MALYPLKLPLWVKNSFPGFVWDLGDKRNAVYLTFDDGPHPEISLWAAEKLGGYGGKGTFFCIGDNVRKHSLTFGALKETQSIGNHTFNHLNGWTTSTKVYFENFEKCESVLDSSSRLFRPPYGRIKSSQARLIRSTHQIIMWDLLSGDFDKRIDPKKNAKQLVQLAKPGSILVFHDSEKAWSNLKEMLPIVLEGLSNRGFSFEAIPMESYTNNNKV